MNKVALLSALCIVLLLLVIHLYITVYDQRYSLNGIWTATPQFCQEAGITSLVLQLRDKNDSLTNSGLPKNGHIVIMEGMNILTNQGIQVSGWGPLKQLKPDFSENVKVVCNDEEILPTKVIFKRRGDRLLLETKNSLFAELYKI